MMTDKPSGIWQHWGAKVLVLQKLLECVNGKLTIDEVNNKLLLDIDPREQIIWHVAADEGNIDLLQKMWDWADENLSLLEF